MTASTVSSVSIVVICILFGLAHLAAWKLFGLKRHAMLWSLSFLAASVGHGLRIVGPLLWPNHLSLLAMLACHASVAGFGFLASGFRTRANRPQTPVLAVWGITTLMLLAFWFARGEMWRNDLRIITALGDAALVTAIVATMTGRRGLSGTIRLLMAIYGLYTAAVGWAAWSARGAGPAGEEFFLMMLSIGTPTGMIATGILTLLLVSGDLARELRDQAMRDPLTGLLNRRGLEVEVKARMERRGVPAGMSLVIADIDRFKSINDRLGHAAGDEVLKRFAGLMDAEFGAAGNVARLGGEEFIIVLPGMDVSETAIRLARLQGSLRERLTDAGTDNPVTASFGLTELHADEDLTEALSRADKALYSSKADGRDRVSILTKNDTAAPGNVIPRTRVR